MSHIQIGRIEVAAQRLDFSVAHTKHIAYGHGSGFAFRGGEIEVELYRDPVTRFGIADDLAIEENQPGKSDNVYIWEALKMKGLQEVQYMEPFMHSEGSRYQNLEPVSENLNPRYSPADKEKGKDLNNLDGRAHMLRTPDKKLCYLYFEGLCNKATVSGLLANQTYEAKWYNPRTGVWSDIGSGSLTANGSGVVTMPNFPGGLTQTADNTDWAAKLVLKNVN